MAHGAVNIGPGGHPQAQGVGGQALAAGGHAGGGGGLSIQ